MTKRNVTLEISLQPFDVPTVVRVVPPEQDPTKPIPRGTAKRLMLVTYPLDALDDITLMALCDEFTDAVFTKAGKTRPIK